MKPTRILAQMTVTDLTAAVDWYTRLLGREPDTRPMDGLVEWYLADTFGIQVFVEPDRAGHSTIVLDAGDVEPVARELDGLGIGYDGPLDVTRFRILQLADPDGNRVVIAGQKS